MITFKSVGHFFATIFQKVLAVISQGRGNCFNR